jgi:hypothetical protein
VIDYRVPPEKFTELAIFDGSVIVERTADEVSARCHDEQANFLAGLVIRALPLAHLLFRLLLGNPVALLDSSD